MKRNAANAKDDLASLPEDGRTEESDAPLIAAFGGSLDFVVPFLQAGGPVSYAGSHGSTMLHAAACGWQFRMVELLILSGANPNARDGNGDTPLHEVTRSQQVPSEGRLLAKEDLPSARVATFRELLLHGADRTITNAKGAAPLHIAAWQGDLPALQALATSDLIDLRTSKGATALVLAVMNNHAESASHLLALGASIELQLPSGHTLREWIASSPNAAVRALLSNHALAGIASWRPA